MKLNKHDFILEIPIILNSFRVHCLIVQKSESPNHQVKVVDNN